MLARFRWHEQRGKGAGDFRGVVRELPPAGLRAASRVPSHGEGQGIVIILGTLRHNSVCRSAARRLGCPPRLGPWPPGSHGNNNRRRVKIPAIAAITTRLKTTTTKSTRHMVTPNREKC